MTETTNGLELPSMAAWRHVGAAREGFEVVSLHADLDGYHFEGRSTGVEDGHAWGVRYVLSLDSNWITRSAHVIGLSVLGQRELRLERDGTSLRRADGRLAPTEVAGCLDVDLEASALTNAFPVNRLRLEVGQRSDAPAAYVRAGDLSVEYLEQAYTRLDDDGGRFRYYYESPRFAYQDLLVYDRSGLVIDYPGLAVRVA
jgi:hypothetical protein